MKKMVWRIVIICLATVLLAYTCLVGLAVWQGNGLSEAIYIETKHGHMLLIDGSPVNMAGKDRLFDGLTTGDQVLVIHGPIAESYPGQAKAYLCIKQEDGSEADIPALVRASLKEMGWLALPLGHDEAEALAHLYTGFAFPFSNAEEDPQTGDWTVELWSEDGQHSETVYISADGQKLTVASGILYR